MKYSRQIRSYGRIQTAVKQGDRETVRNAAEIAEKNRINAICLNCTKPKCTGICKTFAKIREGEE
jgi:hypothetical protein